VIIGSVEIVMSSRFCIHKLTTPNTAGLLGALTCLLVIATCSPSASAEEQISNAARNGHPLTAEELNSIYADHSWRWKDGAAYFGAQHHTFRAWSGSGAKTSYAEGSWSAGDRGRLCFDATWYGVKGHNNSTTCLEHRTDDKNIYQRRLPKGEWYLFGHQPAVSEDEIKKFEPGDKVSEDYKKNKRYVTAHSSRRKHKR
jgi:hypothetical protein